MIPKRILPVLVQTEVDMTTAPRLALARLGHEGHRFAVLPSDLLHALFEKNMPVSHKQRLAVGKIDFVLTAPPFALGTFHRNSGDREEIARRAHDVLITPRLQDVIVDTMVARRHQSGVTGRERVALGSLVDEKLQLAGNLTVEALQPRVLDRTFQNVARRLGHRTMIVVLEITHDKRRPRHPRHKKNPPRIRHHMEVVEPLLPVGHREILPRVLLEIKRDQITADMRPVLGHRLEEVGPGEALARHPAEHIRKSHDHRVDFPRLDFLGQGFEVHYLAM